MPSLAQREEYGSITCHCNDYTGYAQINMSRDRRQSSRLLDITALNRDSKLVNPARIYSGETERRCLDSTQLARLEAAFRSWALESPRSDVTVSRSRILLIFLLIRYTGARLNEVLVLDIHKDIDRSECVVRFGKYSEGGSAPNREVQVSSELMSEIQSMLKTPTFAAQTGSLLAVDAAHVRRKFYERSKACGFDQELGSPNALRKARAVELMRENMPLPVVQRILGHSTPNLTASLVAFSDEDIQQVARHFIERESQRKTSARNTFFGKIGKIKKGSIQSRVELVTIGGDVVTTVITNTSLKRMGLKIGSLVTAEVKAPWVILQKAQEKPLSTAENIFRGTVTQILRGRLTTEFVVRIQDGTSLCSLVTEESRRGLGLNENSEVWAMFNSFAVILRVD
jgi:molybdate transport system regulatory protein